jgi:hypothetical protein
MGRGLYILLWRRVWGSSIWDRFFVHKRIVSAVRRVEYISDRTSYIILRGCWFNFVINVYASCEDKSDDVKDRFYEELECVFDQFPMYDVIILLGDFNVKVGRDSIFKLTIGNESLHEINNDTGVRVVNVATSTNVVLRSTIFPHCNIHKYTRTSPEGKTQPY